MTDENPPTTHKTTGACFTIAALMAFGLCACEEVSIDPDDGAGGSGVGGRAGASATTNGGSSSLAGSGGDAGSGGSSGTSGNAGAGGGSGSGGSGSGGSGSGSGGSNSGSSGSSGSSSDPDAGLGDAGIDPDAALPDGAVLPPQNLISNPDFESGTLPWSAAFGGTLELTTEQVHGGLQSAKVTARTQNYQGAHYDLTEAVTPGATYAVSAFGRIANGATSTATVKLTARIKCSTQSDQYVTIRQLTASDTAWSDLSGGTLTVPTTQACSLVEILMYIEGPPAAYDLYLDDVSVIEL